MGLLAKFNLLTIGLIFLTAAAITGFYLWDQWRDEKSDLRQRTATSLAMLTEMSEFGLRTNNRAYLEAVSKGSPPMVTSRTRSSPTRRAKPSWRGGSPPRSARRAPGGSGGHAPAGGRNHDGDGVDGSQGGGTSS